MSLLLSHDDLRRWFAAAGNDVRAATERAVAEMGDRANGGDIEAVQIVRNWTMGGARQELKRLFLALDQVVIAGQEALPPRMSVRKPDGSRQLMAWKSMTRDEFRAVLDDYRAQTGVRNVRIALMEQADLAWGAHPEISNAADAFTAAGIPLSIVDIAA